jgi:hypothetical protein
LGIVESDIDELALAWIPRQTAARGGSPNVEAEAAMHANPWVKQMPTELSGLLMGRFDHAQIKENAKTNGGLSIQVHELEAYCLPRAVGACLAVLSDSLAAFGEPEGLDRLLATRLGQRGSLGADRRFTSLINQVNRHAPIWGIATGQTVPEWFRGWLPVQGQMQFDWVKTLELVETFTYSIEVSEKLELVATLHAESGKVAQQLQRLFFALRALLGLTWQMQVKDRPSPMSNLRVLTDGRACILRLSGSPDDLMAYQGSLLNSTATAQKSITTGQ